MHTDFKMNTMDALKPFTIPFQGLKIGVHQFEFQIDSSFFTHFEDSAIKQGAVHLLMDLDKRQNMIVLDFTVNGAIKSECDRCLSEIDLPIKGNYQLHIKFSEEEREGDEEVIYIHPKSSHIEIANQVYEFIHLSIPMRKLTPACETQPEDCENNILEYYDDELEEEEGQEDIGDINPIWSELSKFKGK